MNAAATLDAALCTYWVTASALCCAAYAAPPNRRALRFAVHACSAVCEWLTRPRSFVLLQRPTSAADVVRGTWQARQPAVVVRRPAAVVACAQRACACLFGVSCAPSEAPPVQRLHVPHSWFAHFYVLGCFCNGKRRCMRNT